MARLLRPGGVFVLTVPCDVHAPTIEHYPGSVGYDVLELDGNYAVDVTYADGSVRRATDPVFHGGPGSTLELRLFGLADIVEHLRSAGFSGVRVLRDDVPEHGIARDNPHSLPILAYR